MRPILFYLFGMPVASWHLFFALAAVSAYLYVSWLVKVSQDFEAYERLPALFAVVYIFGWFGARGLSILVEQPEVRNPVAFVRELFSLGPMTFYGGACLGAFAGIVYAWVKKLNLKTLWDAGLPAGVLALGIGRLGCTLNGCDYGKPVPLHAGQSPWWAFSFPVLGDGIPRYPVQVEEALFSALLATIFGMLFVFAYTRQTRFARTGVIGTLALLISSLHRFGNEYYRGDFRGEFPGTSLSTSQGVSVLLSLGALLFLGVALWRLKRRKE